MELYELLVTESEYNEAKQDLENTRKELLNIRVEEFKSKKDLEKLELLKNKDKLLKKKINKLIFLINEYELNKEEGKKL